jgi:hypothetical protein
LYLIKKAEKRISSIYEKKKKNIMMLDIVDYLLLVKQECNMPENNFIFNPEHNCFI